MTGGGSNYQSMFSLPKNYQSRGLEVCESCEKMKPIEEFPNPDVKLCKDCYEPKTLFISHRERNSLYNIIKGIQFISLCGEINSEKQIHILTEILSGSEINDENLQKLGRILQEDNIRRLIFYLIQEEAATYLTIVNTLQQPESSVWRNLNLLTNFGIITPSVPVRPDLKKAGRRVVVFQTPDATPERIKEAIEQHRRLKSPIFAGSFRITQLLIDEYTSKGREQTITFRDLVDFTKEHFAPEPINTANLAAKHLQDRGWKIWR